MIPILFPATATTFTSNGTGRLSDCISCEVEEERNGIYELKMVYPVSGAYYGDIATDSIIAVESFQGSGRQPFRVYRITKPLSGRVTVYAQHISYDMSYIPVLPFQATGITATLQGLTSNARISSDFAFWTDLTNEESVYTQTEPKSLRACIGGSEGSLLSTFAGSGTCEFEWDGYTTKVWLHRGTDRGVTVRYGKNMTALTQDSNNEDVVTGAMAYYYNEDEGTLVYGDIQRASGTPEVDRVIVMDLSMEYDSTPSITMLNNAAAAYVNQANIGIPSENIKVSFINLADTDEYASIAPLEDVKLCDTVTVIYSDLGVRASKKVIRTVWDVLLERYSEIELGDSMSSLGDTIKGEVDEAMTGVIRETHKIVTVVTRIDEEVGEISTQVSELEETADFLTESVANLNIRANEIVSMVSETRTELIDGYTSAIDEFGNEISTVYATKSELQQTASSITATITEVATSVDELGNEISTTQQAVASLSTDGLTVNTGGQSSSRIDSDGLKVIGSDGETIAEFTNQNSAVDYLKVRKYLSFGAHRGEAASDTELDGTMRVGTAFFWTGDVS